MRWVQEPINTCKIGHICSLLIRVKFDVVQYIMVPLSCAKCDPNWKKWMAIGGPELWQI